ncbi:MAG TPA: ABC transporter substrate-binding protein [Candidatus Limnocylindria bacterium]|nr:ABC transporter substrate-binding protein [Candidatus Limnocylindria bacterium]
MRLVAFSRPPALVVASRRGFFADEGLEVSFTPTASSRAQLDALLAGDHDVAHTAADNVVARVDAGADLRIVLVADRGVRHRLIGAPAVGTLGALAGRRLGVDAPESGHAILAYVLLAEAGVARGGCEIVAVGSTRERSAALLDGRIDAAMLNAPHDERAIAAGCHVLADAAARFPRHPGLTVAATRAWSAAHPVELEAYCRALLRGARFAADPANRGAVIADLAADQGLAAREAERVYERERQGDVPAIHEMADAVASVCEARRAAGLAHGPFDVQRYFDPSYVQAAEAAGGRR